MNKDWHFREAFKEASERWGREEAGQRAGSCRLCWVLSSHPGGGEEGFWRGDKTRNIFCCSWTSWFYLYRRRWWQPWTRKTRKNNKAVAVLCNDIVIYYAVTVQIQNQQYVIQLFDTAGQEDCDNFYHPIKTSQNLRLTSWPCQVTSDCLPQHRRLPGLLQHHQPRLVLNH